MIAAPHTFATSLTLSPDATARIATTKSFLWSGRQLSKMIHNRQFQYETCRRLLQISIEEKIVARILTLAGKGEITP